MSVWVEIEVELTNVTSKKVTLHVSVWVEIPVRYDKEKIPKVTLHVSVWVEIKKCNHILSRSKSRSTWACELKFNIWFDNITKEVSRSTWACELKSFPATPFNVVLCHAPRERVSWNLQFLEILFRQRVTLHVSVWVEIARRLPVVEEQIVTLHVSVWVEILNTFSEPVDTGVTLHVSVWVEIKLLWN